MTHAEVLPVAAPGLTAVLFGLSGCLVDFGARAHQRQRLPEHADATALSTACSACSASRIPCAWIDELPPALAQPLAALCRR